MLRKGPTASRQDRLPWAALGGPFLLACAGHAQAGDVSAFDEARAWSALEAIVAFGERPAGSPSLERLRAHLARELEGLGLSVVREEFRADTPRGPIDFANLVVDLPPRGEARDAPWIALATHIDTKGRLPCEFVGANDGGSGTAVLLELARCLAARERRVGYRLLFLDGEEAVNRRWEGTDNRYGSRHHARSLARAEMRVGACVVLDMVGDRDLRLCRELESDPKLLALVFAAASAAGLGAHVGAREQAIEDDHLSFGEVGIPSVDLIDFEYGPANSWWHTADDRLDRCSAASLGVAGRIVLAALPALESFVLEGQR